MPSRSCNNGSKVSRATLSQCCHVTSLAVSAHVSRRIAEWYLSLVWQGTWKSLSSLIRVSLVELSCRVRTLCLKTILCSWSVTCSSAPCNLAWRCYQHSKEYCISLVMKNRVHVVIVLLSCDIVFGLCCDGGFLIDWLCRSIQSLVVMKCCSIMAVYPSWEWRLTIGGAIGERVIWTISHYNLDWSGPLKPVE